MIMLPRLLGIFLRFQIPPPRPPNALSQVVIQQDRQIRLQISAQYPMQLQHRFTPQLPPASLIRLRRIRKAIANHNRAALQRRQNQLSNVLRPRGEHQGHLRHRREPLRSRIQKHPPDLLSRCRPARLARFDNLVPLRAQHLRQLAQLRALANSIEPLKCDELSPA